MIRNVILHINSEQPLLADLFEAPSPGDVGLRCTNLRQMNGKRPVFVDDVSVDLLLPVPAHPVRRDPARRDLGWRPVDGGHDRRGPGRRQGHADGEPEAAAEPEADLEIDEDFLRRIREV